MTGRERFPGFDGEAAELLSSISDSAKLSARIDKLAGGDLGKAINISFQDDSPRMTIGYVLPLRTDSLEHLAMFKDGTILVIKPDVPSYYTESGSQDDPKEIQNNSSQLQTIDEANEEIASDYKAMFMPTKLPLMIACPYSRNDIDKSIDGTITYIKSTVKVTCENNMPESLPILQDAFRKVMPVAEEAKRQREVTRRKSVSDLVDMFEIKDPEDPTEIFNHPDEDPPRNSPSN